MSNNRSEYDRVRALASKIGFHGENPCMSERYRHRQRLEAIANASGVIHPKGSNRAVYYQIAERNNICNLIIMVTSFHPMSF